MQARHAELSGATDAQDHPAAIASRCFELAKQIGGGPVCEALTAMGRDYSARARETAQTAGFRIELERSRPDSARFWPLRVLSDLCAPLPPLPARHAAQAGRPTAPAKVQHAAPPPARLMAPAVARSAPADRPRRGSRLYRLHALGQIEP